MDDLLLVRCGGRRIGGIKRKRLTCRCCKTVMRLCRAMLPNCIGGCGIGGRGRRTSSWHCGCHVRNGKRPREWRKEGREMREAAESNAASERDDESIITRRALNRPRVTSPPPLCSPFMVNSPYSRLLTSAAAPEARSARDDGSRACHLGTNMDPQLPPVPALALCHCSFLDLCA
jgi:hypothetical protein